jgi:hypothetical protein
MLALCFHARIMFTLHVCQAGAANIFWRSKTHDGYALSYFVAADEITIFGRRYRLCNTAHFGTHGEGSTGSCVWLKEQEELVDGVPNMVICIHILQSVYDSEDVYVVGVDHKSLDTAAGCGIKMFLVPWETLTHVAADSQPDRPWQRMSHKDFAKCVNIVKYKPELIDCTLCPEVDMSDLDKQVQIVTKSTHTFTHTHTHTHIYIYIYIYTIIYIGGGGGRGQ